MEFKERSFVKWKTRVRVKVWLIVIKEGVVRLREWKFEKGSPKSFQNEVVE